MQIRLMKKNDIETVAKLFVESHEKEDKLRRWEEKYAINYVRMIYRLCKDLCFVAYEGSKILGVSLCVITPEYDRYIVDSKVLLVHPKYRKQKIGTHLLRKTCLKAMRKYDIDVVETSIYTLTNFPISWYESIGFRGKKCYEITRACISEIIEVI